MEDKVHTGLRCLWALLTQTASPFEVRLLNEQVQVSALDRKFYRAVPLAAGLAAWLAVPWAPLWQIAVWFLTVSASAILARTLYVRVSRHKITKGRTRAAILKGLVSELPPHLVWLLYVPMCWVPSDAANNGYLTLFMLASLAATMRVYSPCLHLMMGLLALYWPFCAYFTPNQHIYLDVEMRLLPSLFIVFLAMLALHHYRVFRQSVYRLFLIEDLARELSLAKDISERESKAKSAFLASMSHELRTPLNAIIGFSDLIRNQIAGPLEPPRYRDYVDDIYSSGQLLLALINDVLDLSKIESGKRELSDGPVALADLAWDAVRFVQPQAREKALAVDIEVPAGTVLIADERALRQVLLNLLSNAIKFSPRNDRIVLFARKAKSGGIALGVTDHGIGMDDTGIQKALQPYGQVSLTTNKQDSGTGLGLPIAKALIESHGAAFHIDSTPGEGTTVWGDFPPERSRT